MRRQASQVRMNIQLVEAEVGHQLYAEHYDRDISDVLGVQDEIATSIVGVLEPELLRVERDRASTAPISVAAYDLLQRGLWHHYRRTKEDGVSAQAFFHKALAADPNYAQAAASLSICLSQSMLSGWMPDPQGAIVEAFALAQRAVFLDARDPLAHYALGLACLHSKRIPLGVREMEEAVRPTRAMRRPTPTWATSTTISAARTRPSSWSSGRCGSAPTIRGSSCGSRRWPAPITWRAAMSRRSKPAAMGSRSSPITCIACAMSWRPSASSAGRTRPPARSPSCARSTASWPTPSRS